MSTYLVRRFFQTLAFIFIAWLVVFTVLVYLMPNGPRARYSRALDAGGIEIPANFREGVAVAADLEKQYKLDKPWPLSFIFWLFDPNNTTEMTLDENGQLVESPKGIDLSIGPLRLKGSGVLTGDLGYVEHSTGFSVDHTDLVVDAIGRRWVNTVTMIGMSFVVALLLAIPIGIIAAVRQRSFLDNTLTFATFTGFSIPPFMLGLLLVIIFGVLPYQFRQRFGWEWLPFFPASGVADPDHYDSIPNRLYHLVLPVAALAIPQIALLSRQVRFSMLEVLRQDYIRTAWAKGVTARQVILKHSFRNALIPVITTIGLILPVLLSGAIMIETIFGYQGMGQLYYRALGGCLATGPSVEIFCPPDQRLLPLDHPTTLALTSLIIVVVAFSNMFADMLYTFADPRINYKSR
jgi:peptide/nickel transport system permease protein